MIPFSKIEFKDLLFSRSTAKANKLNTISPILFIGLYLALLAIS